MNCYEHGIVSKVEGNKVWYRHSGFPTEHFIENVPLYAVWRNLHCKKFGKVVNRITILRHSFLGDSYFLENNYPELMEREQRYLATIKSLKNAVYEMRKQLYEIRSDSMISKKLLETMRVSKEIRMAGQTPMEQALPQLIGAAMRGRPPTGGMMP